MATTAVNVRCEGCTCNITYYNDSGTSVSEACSNNSSITVYANKSYKVTLSQVYTVSGYTKPITFYYNTSNGSGYDGHEPFSGTSRDVTNLSFGRTLKLVATSSGGSTIEAHLKCGQGIASYRLNDSNGSQVAKITTKSSYTTLTLTKGATYKLGNIVYEDGWSGIRWYYNSSSSHSSPNTSTTNPDYQLGSNYDRWGYFEATDYTDPTVYYTCYARAGTGVKSATVNSSSSASIEKGSTAQFRCTLKANYEWLGWYYTDTGVLYSDTRNLNVTNLSTELDLTAKATYVPPTTYYTCAAAAYSGCSGMFSSITVNGESSVSVKEGNTAKWRYQIKSGYEFLGWYNSDGAYISGSNPYTISSVSRNTTLYAKAQAITYQYTIRAYRNQSSTDSIYKAYYTESGTSVSQAITMPSCPWSQTGKSFSYWSGNRSGTDGVYYAGKTYYFSSDQDLYAIWETDSYWQGADVVSGSSQGVDSVYVNDIEGGTYVDYGGTAVWKCTVNPGYTFAGWYNSNGTKISSNNPYTRSNVTSALTLYARINATTYSAYASSAGFGCCFSSVKVDKSSFTYGATVTFTADLNPGYTFRGWYNSSGTRVSTSRTYPVTGTGNITLYARADFAWTYNKQSGSSTISAEEFRRLQTYITQRNGASFSSQPNVGDAMTKDYYNLLRNAIGTGSTVVKFQVISAALLNMLRDNANGL